MKPTRIVGSLGLASLLLGIAGAAVGMLLIPALAEGRDVVRTYLPNLAPAILSGCALAFARSVGEFGSVVLISGNIPFKTEVASVHIFGQIESDDVSGAAAVSVVLLATSLVALIVFDAFRRWRFGHEG